MQEKLQRMQLLIEELNQASDAYYNGKAELMSDHEWDARFDELKRLEEETGEILPDSPTQKVSEDHVEGQKEEHEFPALSLAKTKQVTDLEKWAEGRPIWISWKLDGLTLVVTYDNGQLTKVVTRGNGHIGTNITHLSKVISGIPQRISEKGHVVIRGEAVISYEDFNNFLIESGEDYANPRNLASGSLTLKDSSGTVLLTYDSPKEYSVVQLSCPALKSGETYTLTAGDQSVTIEMDSLHYGQLTGMRGGSMGGHGPMGDQSGSDQGGKGSMSGQDSGNGNGQGGPMGRHGGKGGRGPGKGGFGGSANGAPTSPDGQAAPNKETDGQDTVSGASVTAAADESSVSA